MMMCKGLHIENGGKITRSDKKLRWKWETLHCFWKTLRGFGNKKRGNRKKKRCSYIDELVVSFRIFWGMLNTCSMIAPKILNTCSKCKKYITPRFSEYAYHTTKTHRTANPCTTILHYSNNVIKKRKRHSTEVDTHPNSSLHIYYISKYINIM